MLGRNGNTAYVRYDSQGRIVAGGPIISSIRPKNGNWIAVSNVLGTNTTGTNGNILRAFIRLDMFGRVVPSSLVIQTKEPSDANSGTGWIELNAIYRGSTTTTTTSSSTSTSTSTTTSSTSSTTTSSTTSTTTTSLPYSEFSLGYSVVDGNSSCAQFSIAPAIYYMPAGSFPADGNILFVDSTLTTPVPVGFYSDGVNNWNVYLPGGSLFNETPCPTTTTTTTTLGPAGYRYRVSNYYCDNCAYYGGSDGFTNSEPLTVGKYYSFASIYSLGVVYIEELLEIVPPQVNHYDIPDSIKKDTCAEVGCPS